MTATIFLHRNGPRVELEVDPATPVLWLVRDHPNLTGTKYGCGIGASTVVVDGHARAGGDRTEPRDVFCSRRGNRAARCASGSTQVIGTPKNGCAIRQREPITDDAGWPTTAVSCSSASKVPGAYFYFVSATIPPNTKASNFERSHPTLFLANLE
jgi:hypothetical protein